MKTAMELYIGYRKLCNAYSYLGSQYCNDYVGAELMAVCDAINLLDQLLGHEDFAIAKQVLFR